MQRKIVHGALVCNEATTKAGAFTTFTWNLKTALVRNGTLEGKPCKIVPMVMITEGVLNGSNGPLLYPRDELSKVPGVWNAKPVCAGHPSNNGTGISACDPDVFETHKIGVIMNAAWDGKQSRLTAEAYIDEEKCKKVDNRIWESIEKQKVMELSTGLYSDNEFTEGTFKGTHYDGIARNYRPDHLAVLPDTKGACSVKDGAGFVRNELSHSDLANRLSEIVRAKLPSRPSKVGGVPVPVDVWVCDVYDKTFVYCTGGKCFQQSYTVDQKTDKVELSGSAVQVMRETQYRPVVNAIARTFIQKVNYLIATNAFAESARQWLETLDAAPLNRLYLINYSVSQSRSADGRFGSGSDGMEPRAGSGASQVAAERAADKAYAATQRAETTGKASDHGKASDLHTKAAGLHDTALNRGAAELHRYAASGHMAKARTASGKESKMGAYLDKKAAETERAYAGPASKGNKVTKNNSISSRPKAGQTQNNQNNTTMDKTKIVDGLIANEASGWAEDDREFLLGCPDEQLEKIAANAAAPDEEEEPPAKPAKKGKMAANGKKKVAVAVENEDEPAAVENDEGEQVEQTPEEYIANAPASMQDLLRSGLATLNQQKAELVAALVKNKACKFTKEVLTSMSLEMLQNMAALATNAAPAKSKPLFTGLASAQSATINEGYDAGEVLEAPTMNFSKEAKTEDEPALAKK